MAQSLAQIFVHVVFSTKYRENIVVAEDLSELFAYIGGTLNKIGCPTIIVGGVSNHVHVLCSLNKNLSVAKLIERVKRSSNLWLRKKKNIYLRFEWQGGYAAFSVSRGRIDNVVNYIRNQAEHHKKRTYEEELLWFLEETGLDYNPDYLFDRPQG